MTVETFAPLQIQKASELVAERVRAAILGGELTEGGSLPTEKALIYMVDHLPKNCIWNVSVMNPVKQWDLLSLAVSLGGHVRVGYEDNPYMAPGEFAKNNAVLVERMVGIARGLGREVATPDEARRILGLTRSQ